MGRSALEGCSILVVEDEPLIVMDIQLAFEDSGAELYIANTVKDALPFAKHGGLSLGVLDHGLADGQSTELYQRLHDRGVPFIIYTGHNVPLGERSGGTVVSKPAIGESLRSVAEGLVTGAGALQHLNV